MYGAYELTHKPVEGGVRDPFPYMIYLVGRYLPGTDRIGVFDTGPDREP